MLHHHCRWLLAALLLGQVTAVSAEVCLPPNQPLPTALINAFRDNPRKTLLEDTPPTMLQSVVNSIVAADTTLAPQVVALLSGLPGDQSSSIGSGLGMAVLGCRQNYPGDQAKIEAATLVQQALAATDNTAALASYNTAAQNVATAAVGTAAAGGGLGSANNGGIPTGGANPGGVVTLAGGTRTTAPSLLNPPGFGGLSILPSSAR
ncbi:hypothetical protein [Bosea vaviloviae]|uniref:Uncharacterized protein n=1 Tax=Bosea vaviloviae TaxID=1526658 RepID=A0A0N1F619_9HYPH|nr:hypothetical protein [Bosea vaviloviae]KPH81460.1 hypothetical protein AE618_06745 [Bosea vaviloviae]